MEDGISRNGYHKVKCQVPETEELQGRTKGGEEEELRSCRGSAEYETQKFSEAGKSQNKKDKK